MTDDLTPAKIEANMREINLVMSRFAAVLLPAFDAYARELYTARPIIGEAVWKERHRALMTREQFAARFNIPRDVLVRVERWRLLRDETEE